MPLKGRVTKAGSLISLICLSFDQRYYIWNENAGNSPGVFVCVGSRLRFKALRKSPDFFFFFFSMLLLLSNSFSWMYRLYDVAQAQPLPMKRHCRWKQLIRRDKKGWKRWDHFCFSRCGSCRGAQSWKRDPERCCSRGLSAFSHLGPLWNMSTPVV